jgi:uncharacterized protein (DUF608 family)
MPMGSGPPLGGIGTGFIELRPDGCFHEWQIFNSGPWAQNARSTTAAPGAGPQCLRFLVRTRNKSATIAQVRRLYLRSDESNNYSLPFVQDVESIDYQASFPVTHLQYNDTTIPAQLSALAFSPFIPGSERDSATPGFHLVFTVENPSSTEIEVSLLGFLDNPLASALPERHLANTIAQDSSVTSLYMSTSAKTDFPSGIGDICLSVSGGQHSYIAGTFQNYTIPGVCHWETTRARQMLLDVLNDIFKTGTLPNSNGSTDPTLKMSTEAEIEAMSTDEVQAKIGELSADPLLNRIFSDAEEADPNALRTIGKDLLKEVRTNLLGKGTAPRLAWGTGALSSTVKLAPGEKAEVRFTLSWYFPHHLTAIRLANDSNHSDDLRRWTNLLGKASTNFDKLLFNGDYYSLWVDGTLRDELCMTDQISGEWFSHLIGLPATISEENLARSVDHIFRNNFNPEFGVTTPLLRAAASAYSKSLTSKLAESGQALSSPSPPSSWTTAATRTA